VILQMLLALVFALWPVLARAQAAATDNASIYSYNGPDREQRLIAKAREEGTLALYTSMATTESARLAQAFERRYGIKVQLWRALSENVLQRALAEARGRRRAMDVVETNAPEVEALAREQVIAPFDSPYVADLPAWAVPPHRRWFSDRANLWVTGYNTEKVKREELPPTLAGFAAPAWKGRLSLEATDYDWMSGVISYMGETRGEELFRQLSALKPEMRKGHVLLAQLVVVDRATGRAPASAGARRQCAASACRAAVRRFCALARGHAAAQRAGACASEPNPEDAARCEQICNDRSDQIDRRSATLGEALERAVSQMIDAGWVSLTESKDYS
jgi:hypothetical protein